MPLLDETCRNLKASGVPAGLHLCLTQGQAVAKLSSVSDLVDEAGNFRHSALNLLLLRTGTVDRGNLLRQIEEEFSAQLARAKDHGIALTHVDSHQHIHMNADIFSIAQNLAPRFGVPCIRLTREPAWPMFTSAGLGQAIRRTNHIKWLLLRWLARELSPQLPTTDAFFGVLHSGTISKLVLMQLLRGLSPDRSNEICIHPGFPAPAAQATPEMSQPLTGSRLPGFARSSTMRWSTRKWPTLPGGGGSRSGPSLGR